MPRGMEEDLIKVNLFDAQASHTPKGWAIILLVTIEGPNILTTFPKAEIPKT